MSEVEVKKDNAGNKFVDGGNIPTEYVNVELAKSLDSRTLADIEERAADKFGADFAVIQEWIEALRYLTGKNKDSVKEQHDVIAGLAIIAPFFPISTVGLRGEFALFQVLACKKLDIAIQGIQPWEDYFYTEQEAEAAVAAAE